MNIKKIILCNERNYFEPIGDRIEFEFKKESPEILYARTADEALLEIPEEGDCVIITESLVPYSKNEKRTDGARAIAKQSKVKNPNCKTILLSSDFFDLEQTEFSFCINAFNTDSMDIIIKKLREFGKN